MARKNGYCAVEILMIALLCIPFLSLAQDTVTFNKTFDFNHGYETGTSVVTADDGYLVCATGYATEYDGWRGLKLLKTDFDGNEIWRKVYGEEKKSFTSGWYGALTALDNGYILAAGILDSGNTYAKGIIYRFDEFGDTIWTKVFPKAGYSFFNSVRQTPDKGFIAVGNQNISGVRHYWLVKTDSLGSTEWDTTLIVGYASTIEVTPDSGYVIGGAGGSFLSSATIVKTDKLGQVQWNRIHFAGNQHGCYWSAGLASDGGYYIWGCYDTVINPTDFYLTATVAKLDSTGNRLWTKFFNNADGKLIMLYQVKELPDGSILVGGERDNNDPLLASGGWLVKMDRQGNVLWEKLHATTQDSTVIIGPNNVYDFNQTIDAGLIVTGYGFNDIDPGPNFNRTQDIWLLKLDSLGNWYAPADTDTCPPPCDTVGIGEIGGLRAKVYPNPNNGKLTVELPNSKQGAFLLYNLLGQAVLEREITNGTGIFDLPFPSGVYLYRISTPDGKVQTGKLVVE